MCTWILEYTHGAFEEFHSCYLFTRLRAWVQQRTGFGRPEGDLHQLGSHEPIGQIGHLADSHLDGLHGRENGQLVLSVGCPLGYLCQRGVQLHYQSGCGVPM